MTKLAVAQAVSYIHACEVIHCDIKPSNIYVAVRDGPPLFDFGFARSLRGGSLRGGTLAYMAPEQLHAVLDPRCWAEIGPAVDSYALGLTLVELLLGEPPDFSSRTLPEFRAGGELVDLRSRPDWPARIAARCPPAAAGGDRRALPLPLHRSEVPRRRRHRAEPWPVPGFVGDSPCRSHAIRYFTA